jgi:hypothetical protein
VSYWDIAEMAQNLDLQARIFAAGAQEQVAVAGNMLRICSAPGWADEWASAVAGGVERPGKDAAVISDSEILAAVQALATELAEG